MKILVYSQKGSGKNECEDAALIVDKIISDSYYEVQTGQISCVALADGVGGNAGGAYASRYVLDQLKEISMAEMSENYLKQYMTKINENLLCYASSILGKENMATTLTGICIGADDGYIFHTGNTRVYGMQGNYLKQLTEDQTTYQWLCSVGQADAAEQCNKNEITHCLGGGNRKYGDSVIVKKNDALDSYKRLILTTDGIHEYVSIDELEEFASGEVSEQTMQKLIGKAMENGSADDQTMIVIDRM